MNNANFSGYEVDLADIWEYEREDFISRKIDEEVAQKVFDLIQPIIIRYVTPSFGEEMIKINQDYYGRNVLDYIKADLRVKYQLDYFFHEYDCYEYGTSIVLSKEEKYFDFFFALKLRQYNKNLFEVINFLNFQIRETFKGSAQDAFEFIDTVLDQYNTMFTDGLHKKVRSFLDKIGGNRTSIKTERKSNGIALWQGSEMQLKSFYQFLNGQYIEKMPYNIFKSHFTNGDIQQKINWLIGPTAFIELFDKLASNKYFHPYYIKVNSQIPTNKYVLRISMIIDHFLFMGKTQKESTLVNTRSQFYRSNNVESRYHKAFQEILETLKQD